MRKFNLNFKIGLVLLSVVAVFILTHVSPALAIRTKLFVSGHPLVAISTELTLQSTEENALVYEVANAPRDRATATVLDVYRVEKQLGFFYSANYRGV